MRVQMVAAPSCVRLRAAMSDDAFATLPVKPPLLPMLAEAQEEVPVGAGWIYEPKWDGFRGLIFRNGDAIRIGSRNMRPLERFFPELVAIFRDHLPEKCIVDGEILIQDESGLLDFEALQMRLHPAPSRIKKLSQETPAGFAAFDLLALGDEDLRERTFVERRAKLEEILKAKPHPRLTATPQTRDAAKAREWVTGNAVDGLDGVVAKREEQTYVHGSREMVKVKPRRTADVVVGGFRMHKDGKGVGSLLLGLYGEDGTLHHVGHTAAFTAAQRRDFLKKLEPYLNKPSFGGEYLPGAPSRWSQGKEMAWTSVEPVFVCEVKFDRMMAHGFRHAATFLRWREDKDPRQCDRSQLSRSDREG